jgi:hypothetical protein
MSHLPKANLVNDLNSIARYADRQFPFDVLTANDILYEVGYWADKFGQELHLVIATPHGIYHDSTDHTGRAAEFMAPRCTRR